MLSMRQANVGFERLISHYKKLFPLCFTNCSQVYVVYDLETRQHRIMKFVPKILPTGSSNNECELTKLMDHPNIVRILDSIDWGDYEILVFPKIKGGSITDIVCKGVSITLSCFASIFFRILLALQHMHSKFVLHGDISPNNIMFEGDSPVLIDLGSSERLWNGRTTTKVIATPDFCAPEALKGNRGLASDIFALGRTFCYLAEGRSGFKMVGGLWESAPQSLSNLIRAMTSLSENMRPTALQCLQHSFFHEVLGSSAIEAELLTMN